MTSKSALKSFLVATLVALLFRLFICEQFRISSASMEPNLLQGDLVLVLKSAFSVKVPFTSVDLLQIREPARSEIVAFSVPGHGSETYVKRVIALAGDRVEIKEGLLWINGQMARYQETPETDILESLPNGKPYRMVRIEKPVPDYGPVDVPAGHFFAMGDNRSESMDSRTWGPVPYSCLKGKVSLIWLSIQGSGEIRPKRWLYAIH